MSDLDLCDLDAFLAIARAKNFRRAAVDQHVSVSSLSQRLRDLEERLGVRLMNRTTRSVAPTDAGERLLTQLRPLLEGFDAAIESVNAFREKPAGHLRLTMPPPVATGVLVMCSGCNESSAMAAPVMSAMLSSAPTSWK